MSAAPLAGPSRGCQIGLSSRLPACALPRRLATHIGSQATRRSRYVIVAAAANEEVRRSAACSGARRTLRSRWPAGSASKRWANFKPRRAHPPPSQVPDASYDFVARYQGAVRSLPLWGGALGFGGLLLNRAISGVSGGRAQSSYVCWFHLQRQPLTRNRKSHCHRCKPAVRTSRAHH